VEFFLLIQVARVTILRSVQEGIQTYHLDVTKLNSYH